MKHKFFLKRTTLIASLVLLSLILPVGTFADETTKDTRALQNERLKEMPAKGAQGALKSCWFRIPLNLNFEQVKLVRKNCQKVVDERAETSLRN